jgi:hypothetical protein
MGYRTILEASPETVQDLELSAWRRLDEASVLCIGKKYHTSIYIAGLSAEMFLKTACFFLGGAQPADRVDTLLAPVRPRVYTPPFRADFESGHGLWFWSQELIDRRKRFRFGRPPNRFLQIMASLYLDWFIGMRYRPGAATPRDAIRFITQVRWIADNHAALRR